MSRFLGPFQLIEPIAQGAMSTVWAGVHRGQRVPVAIKILTAQHARSTSYRAAFRNEVQAAARLHHRGIALTFDHGEVPPEVASDTILAGSPYLVMELAHRGTLADLTEIPAWQELRQSLLELLDALAHAHARGIIHRDLKPANVLLPSLEDLRPGIKLCDFGIAHASTPVQQENATDAEPTSDLPLAGTPKYMAPEQFRGDWRDHGPWTDLYSLGCLVWQMVTGETPFRTRGVTAYAQAHLYAEPPRLAARRRVPQDLEAWLLRLLRKEPNDRFACAADAAHALRALPPVVEDGHTAPASVGLSVVSSPTFVIDGPIAVESLVAPPVSTEPARLLPVTEDRTFPETWDHDDTTSMVAPLRSAGLGMFGLRTIPIVGRVEERNRLWQALRQTHVERSVRATFLHGPAGTGKSRLVEWLIQRASELGAATAIKALHDPLAGPHHGLEPMIARHFATVGLSSEQALARIARLLRNLGAREPAEWEALADLIAPSDRQGVQFGTPAERYAVLWRVLRRLAEGRPIVVWMDDVQWGGDALAFTRHVLEHGPAAPVLFVLTARDEALADEGPSARALERLVASGAERITVGPLPPDDHRELVRRLLGLSDAVAEQVEGRTLGNPLFAVQLVGDWVERGILVPTAAGFALLPDAPATLPDDLHAVWTERLLRVVGMDTDAWHGLEAAAILGQQVAQDEWAELCALAGLQIPVQALDALVSSRLAHRTHGGFSFAHAMARESLERTALERGRFARLHGLCATLLASRSGRGLHERRGRHLLHAGNEDEALLPLFLGAVELRAQNEVDRSLHLLARCEEAMKKAAVPANDARWGQVTMLQASLLSRLGKLTEARALADRTHKEALRYGWSDLEADSLYRMGRLARLRGLPLEALERFQAAHQCYEDLGSAGRLARTLLEISACAIQLGDAERGARAIEEALPLGARAGDIGLQATMHAALARLQRAQESWDQAVESSRKAAELYAESGQLARSAEAKLGIADTLRLAGRLDEAIPVYRSCLSQLDLLGHPAQHAARLGLAVSCLALGDGSDAPALLAPVEDAFLRQRGKGTMATYHLVISCSKAQAGLWEDWDEHLKQATQLLDETGYVDPDVAWIATLAGDLAQRAQQGHRALEAYQTALAQWERLDRPEKVRTTEDRMTRALVAAG